MKEREGEKREWRDLKREKLRKKGEERKKSGEKEAHGRTSYLVMHG